MLGRIGPIAKEFLKRRGYLISKPTPVELAFTSSVWDRWFSRDPQLFASVYQRNRETLGRVKEWLSEETIAKSLWRYGVPAEWSKPQCAVDRTGLVDCEYEITAADLLSFVARRMGDVSYLEIGVSVGKNLLQIDHQLTGASLVGIDIEELNPVLQDQFSGCETIGQPSAPYTVETLSGKPAQKRTTVQRLKSERGNTFDYLSADEFRSDTWEKLKGRNFNLIFSDGVHSAKALRTEMQFLLSNKLIDPKRCVMFWDDLHSPAMQAAFLDSARTLCRMFNSDDDSISLFRLHGSYGFQRPMGMFSSSYGEK
jgi:hypothetical protein